MVASAIGDRVWLNESGRDQEPERFTEWISTANIYYITNLGDEVTILTIIVRLKEEAMNFNHDLDESKGVITSMKEVMELRDTENRDPSSPEKFIKAQSGNLLCKLDTKKSDKLGLSFR